MGAETWVPASSLPWDRLRDFTQSISQRLAQVSDWGALMIHLLGPIGQGWPPDAESWALLPHLDQWPGLHRHLTRLRNPRAGS